MTVRVTDATFATDVLQADGPVLVDLWAEWCAPCRAIAPVLDELADDFGDKLTVAKVNVDEAKDVAQRYNVASIPTVIVFQDGTEVERLVGLRQIEDYREALERAAVA